VDDHRPARTRRRREHCGSGVDLVVIATPDHVIASVAAAIDPVGSTVVAHLAGSRGLDVLAPHERRGAMHPLMTMPDERSGAASLRGAWFAVAGDPLVHDVVRSLDGHSFTVTDEHRALYHAAACVAANHLVALLGQVERLAAAADVPFAAFFGLIRAAVDNTERLGPAAASPDLRHGVIETIRRHLARCRKTSERMRRWSRREGWWREAPRDHRLSGALDAERAEGRVVGLVPTMGYLHAGHRSLMHAAVAGADVAAVTIFVNPLQFAPTEDLSTYPRDLDRDLSMARDAGIAHVFHPSVDEMYPEPIATTVSVSGVSEPLEGSSRPTHCRRGHRGPKLFSIAGAGRSRRTSSSSPSSGR
jgi:hypothetical protein